MNATTITRHPIRGFLYGILFGLGLMLIVVGQGIAALGTWPPFIVLILGIVAGVVWSMYGPAKGPKDVATTDARTSDPEVILFGDSDKSTTEE